MTHLVEYVRAIFGLPARTAIRERQVERQQWLDQGYEVTRETVLYRFADGVSILRTEERDAFPTGLACAECFIDYRVVEPAGLTIEPAGQRFDSACRERYWLRYHSA